jgi:hypothetical protein
MKRALRGSGSTSMSAILLADFLYRTLPLRSEPSAPVWVILWFCDSAL